MPDPQPCWRIAWLSAALTLALSLCACAVQSPSATSVAAVKINPLLSLPAGLSHQPLPARWWQLYEDPALNHWVQQALAHNQDLAAAQANVQAMLAGIGEFASQRWPATSLGMAVDYGRTADDQTLAQARGRRAPAQWQFNPTAELAYQLDVWGQVGHAIERAQVQAEAANEAYDLLRINVATQTSRAYIEQCTFGARIAVTRRSLQTLERSVALSERQRQAGIATELDSVRLQSLREQVSAELPLLEAHQRMAQYELAMLSGQSTTASEAEAHACQSIPSLNNPLPSGDGWHLLQQRPDVRQAERELSASRLQVDIVRADLYPKVSFGVSLTSSSPRLNGLGDSHAVMFGIGPLISWQFPDLQANRARVGKAQALADSQQARFHSVVLAALKDVRQALALYDGERQRQQALALALQQSQRGFELAEAGLRGGSVDALALLDSERDLIAVRARTIDAQGRLALSEINVFKALGGSWHSDRLSATPPASPPHVGGHQP